MWKIIIIALVILLLFGAKRIPSLFKGVGEGIKGFKDETKGLIDDNENSKKEEE